MTLGNLLKIERKWQKIPLSSLCCFVTAGFLYAIGSILTLKALVLRAGLGGGADLERAADRQFLPGEDHA